MPAASPNTIVTRLRQAVLPAGGDLSDGQLLGQFIDLRDEAAFEALVRRHGPMVLGVCRRLLGNPHDADDAFQATFLILIHKAASLQSRELFGNWLYGVAYNTALAAMAKNNRRRSKERQVTEMPEPAVTPSVEWSELRPLLDHELSRLSDVYREAVVLCVLEGKTRSEAAEKLGIPVGTMSSRLDTAYRQLAKRLARHGLTVSGGALATILSHDTLTASVPSPLVVSAVKAAAMRAASASVAALTERVLKTMFLTKVRSVATISLAVVLAVGLLVGSFVAATAPAQEKSEKKEPPAPKADPKNEATKEEKPAAPEPAGDKELEALKGTWYVDTMTWADKSMPKELMKGYKFVFAGNKLTWEAAIGFTSRAGQVFPSDGAFPCDFKIYPGKTPREIDITFHRKQGDSTVLGIYEIKGDELKLCYYASSTGRRPAELSGNDDARIGCVTLTRTKKAPGSESKEAKEAEKLFHETEAKLITAKTLECDFEGKFDGTAMKGTLLLGEGNKFRGEWTCEGDGQPKLTYLHVSDGEKHVVLINGKKQTGSDRTAQDNARFLRAKLSRSILYLPVRAPQSLPGARGMEFKIDDEFHVADFQFGKKETIAAQEVQVVEYRLSRNFGKGAGSQTTVWIDTKSLLPVKRVSQGGRTTQTFTRWAVDEKIDPKRFELPKE